jgi:tetratricopeptide (TPR) repeat protein
MTKTHYLVLFLALVLFFGLYLGFDTKPTGQKTVEKSIATQEESTSFESLLSDAKAQLTATQKSAVAELEQKSASAKNDSERVQLYKQLSGLWYGLNQIAVAGGYAEQSATIENADSSWSVVGATFFNALLANQDPVVRSYCADHAAKAFESAASLNPTKVEHRVNLALVYAENPKPDNPMQAVLLLRELESKHPENPAVYNALGRLAIKTGQWQRAIDRLEKAWSLDKKNPNTPCLLAKAYEGAGQMDKSAEYAKICNK